MASHKYSWELLMSHDFVPVQWNRQKYVYDGILILAIFIFLASFIISGSKAPSADMMILMIRGFGACAIVLLHIVLTIGPLARLSDASNRSYIIAVILA